ncbi:hypothetical protein [Hydrogenophaga sp.]|uniref:hypothetical protein n=1 Tax=Hydrogenophaga sp. TaxID=1904254 RepID=UPI002FC7C58E
MYLGIERHSGLIYVGSTNADTPAIPLPTVTHAKLIAEPDDWHTLPGPTESFGWVFLEDSFDAVSRTRRGRLYGKKDGGQPENVFVSPHPYDRPGLSANNGTIQKSLYVYMACNELLALPNRGQGSTLALGSNRGASAWLIVQAEALYSGAVMVTLKAKSAYGIVPELDLERINSQFRAPVRQAVAKVVDSAFKEAPGSVVDNCKDAMQVVMSSWLAQDGNGAETIGMEVAKVADLMEKVPNKKLCAANLGKIAGLLHARNKLNVVLGKGYRPLQEEDAEFALQSLGLTLRELGWAKNP